MKYESNHYIFKKKKKDFPINIIFKRKSTYSLAFLLSALVTDSAEVADVALSDSPSRHWLTIIRRMRVYLYISNEHCHLHGSLTSVTNPHCRSVIGVAVDGDLSESEEQVGQVVEQLLQLVAGRGLSLDGYLQQRQFVHPKQHRLATRQAFLQHYLVCIRQ